MVWSHVDKAVEFQTFPENVKKPSYVWPVWLVFNNCILHCYWLIRELFHFLYWCLKWLNDNIPAFQLAIIFIFSGDILKYKIN